MARERVDPPARPDPTERFAGRVADYVRSRPGYPPGVVEALVEEVGLGPDWVVADIGAGTGLSAEVFLDCGCAVVAVEPNRAMRLAAESRLGGRPGFRAVAGTAEATGLDHASVDLIVAAQAFHWFDVEPARAEFRRILAPDGWVALLWNTRRIDASPFLRDYEALLLRHGTDYRAVRHDRADGLRLDRFFDGAYRRRVLYNEQTLTREGLEARLLSSSYTPAAGDPARALVVRELDEVFRRHQVRGRVRLEYDTELYVGRPATSDATP